MGFVAKLFDRLIGNDNERADDGSTQLEIQQSLHIVFECVHQDAVIISFQHEVT
jgi:hypothetical protein